MQYCRHFKLRSKLLPSSLPTLTHGYSPQRMRQSFPNVPTYLSCPYFHRVQTGCHQPLSLVESPAEHLLSLQDQDQMSPPLGNLQYSKAISVTVTSVSPEYCLTQHCPKYVPKDMRPRGCYQAGREIGSQCSMDYIWGGGTLLHCSSYQIPLDSGQKMPRRRGRKWEPGK